jgi:hypothetical protein
MDRAVFQDDRTLRVLGPSQTPQPAPRANDSRDTLALSVNRIVTSSSHVDGFEATRAVDNQIRTGWRAGVHDRTPWLMVDLDQTVPVMGSRVIFADEGLDYDRDALPAPYRYVIETSRDARLWQVAVDRSHNQVEQHIVFDRIGDTPARYVRLRIVGTPPGMGTGVLEWTIFGYRTASHL